ncbi:unnamed protein product, partial [Mesorhabditis belari]|uniref:Dimethylglycine dehydrogenase n=1 Tax=Mesorhabditis belari TaxID=2138241 RepID=A0AAF3EJY9_9BILA
MHLTRRCNSSVQHHFAVVMGSGVAGSSLTYHLTKRGIKDVLLLDKGAAGTPAATSFHSPGLVSASHPAHRYKPILAYSVELYKDLEKETGEPVHFERVGTIRLATNKTRLDEFKRYVARDYFKEGDACKTDLLKSPEEVLAKAGIIDKSKLYGGLYTSNDGYVNARGLNRAFIKGTVDRGGKILHEVDPEFIDYDMTKKEWLIGLKDGTSIRTKNLVNAGGIWANDIAKLSHYKGTKGFELPLVIAEHQYAVITPKEAPPADLPALIDHDSTFYLRKTADGKYIFGGFEPMSKVVFRKDWLEGGVPKEGSKLIKPDFSRLDVAWKRAQELIPSIRGADLEPRAAVFSMAPDGYPLVGPYKRNYWLSTGFLDGVSSAGGVGKYLSDWMVDGEPPSELFDTDASRFDDWATKSFIAEKSRETYSMYYNWSYTNRMAGRPTQRVSGVYGRLKKDGAFFTYRNGWEVTQHFNVTQYSKLEDNVEPEFCDAKSTLPTLCREYEMVTNKCGIIDLSWKGKIEVKGKDAMQLMDYVIAGPTPTFGKIGSGLMLTRQGRLLSPLKIFHHDSYRSAFILVTEPERESRDLYWLKRAATEKNLDVEVNLISHYLASLALVGPNSRQILQELTKSDLSESGFPVRSTRLIRLGTVPVIAARTSTSTGQLSYELFHNRADSIRLYDAIWSAGHLQFGVHNFGQATMNMLRLEHGYKIWGRELTLDTNPFECGIGNLVNFDKKEFIGKAAAIELSKQKFHRRLSLITFDTNLPFETHSIPSGMEVVRKSGCEERVGQITSGAYSVRLQCPIAFAWLNDTVQANDTLSVDVGTGRALKGKILEFIPHSPIH